MLPERFLARMERLLGAEYEAFYTALSDGKAEKAVRVNLAKATPEEFLAVSPFPVEPIPFLSEGFFTKEDRLGQYPCHHSGMIYAQDPSAMATVAALDIDPAWRVLDLCAAPGGKATQIAARLSGGGHLVANEFVPSRCKILVGNVERLGLPNVTVMNSDVFRIRALYESYFDLVVVDAPCSGEGMLRKYGVAGEEWTEENVKMCAVRQAELLDNVAHTVASGGYLLYSTCTFSLEENEGNVDKFLRNHTDFHLIPVRPALSAVTSDGIAFDGCETKDIALCRRFYPHVFRGEGQFIALMRRDENGAAPRVSYKNAAVPLSKSDAAVVRAFLRENLAETDGLSVVSLGGRPTVLPEGGTVPPHAVFSAGVLLGEVRKGLLLPHHQFFMAYGKRMHRILSLSSDDPRVAAYLHGEEIDASLPNGWAAVTVDGCTVGGVKVSSGRAKNHYPKGLRNNH